ncbi:hypothetical protein HMP0721_0694 [Pseudoramibacter alactolyticus ATCC 23263]|uniref:Uncharacterized protein n=1 Tax=Pseudoramibacter alactolyticus ATCC 23263 TaxID=887929 RepID=E6MFB1_9FIRM|nr:hypothetical protein HMP0721_0694 [Pseudoramibacter alactolyticus ATCC 23263]
MANNSILFLSAMLPSLLNQNIALLFLLIFKFHFQIAFNYNEKIPFGKGILRF